MEMRTPGTATTSLGPYPPHPAHYQGNAIGLARAHTAWRTAALRWAEASLPDDYARAGAPEGRRVAVLKLALGSLRDTGRPATAANVRAELARWRPFIHSSPGADRPDGSKPSATSSR